MLTGDGVMVRPQYDSGWVDIQASSDIAYTTKYLTHGLGETPLLVDVQSRAVDGPNQWYIFQASGKGSTHLCH